MRMDTRKLDLYKTHAKEYSATSRPAIVTVGPAQYLCVEGRGAPEGAQYAEALTARPRFADHCFVKLRTSRMNWFKINTPSASLPGRK